MSETRIILNGKEENFAGNARLVAVWEEIKRRAQKLGTIKSEVLSWNIEINSENNFPTAAGLASSAAGYACLVFALAKLYKLGPEQDISGIARLGSGSACRSIFGGFVQWVAGTNANDSIAVQLAPASHWPEMRIIVLVVNDQKKSTSSTGGMSRAVKTSELLRHRAEKIMPGRVKAMQEAIQKKDFAKFAEITMKDSNQFHATCLDTYPPIKYMNDVSHAIAAFVHQFNDFKGETKVAYTYDAGPNACLYLLEKDVDEILGFIQHVLPNDLVAPVEYYRGIPTDVKRQLSVSILIVSPYLLKNNTNNNFQTLEQAEFQVIGKNLLKFIIHTKVGEGPQLISSSP